MTDKSKPSAPETPAPANGGLGVLALAAGFVLWRYHRVAVKQFGGITGDLAGWFLQKAELYMLAALVFCQWKGFL